jgi:hypothetical protein
MATAAETMRIVSNRTGLDYGNVRNIARRLIETGVWPAGYGATVPQLSTEHVVLLLLALLADCRASDAPRLAQDYFNLVPAKSHNDQSALTTAGDWICQLFGAFDGEQKEAEIFAYRNQIEVCCTNAAVRFAVTADDGDPIVSTFLMPGSRNTPWEDHDVKRSMTLPGAVIMRIAYDLAESTRALHYEVG